MYDNDPGRTVALVIIGVYLGVAGVLYWIREQDWKAAHCQGLSDAERRLFLLENPDLAEPGADAEES